VRDIGRIVDRILQARRVRVCAVTDDQRHTLPILFLRPFLRQLPRLTLLRLNRTRSGHDEREAQQDAQHRSEETRLNSSHLGISSSPLALHDALPISSAISVAPLTGFFRRGAFVYALFSMTSATRCPFCFSVPSCDNCRDLPCCALTARGAGTTSARLNKTHNIDRKRHV